MDAAAHVGRLPPTVRDFTSEPRGRQFRRSTAPTPEGYFSLESMKRIDELEGGETPKELLAAIA